MHPGLWRGGGLVGGSEGPVGRKFFRDLYGRLVDGTGWTFAQIDEMELDDVADLTAYWNEVPPLAVAARAFFGFERKDPDVVPLRTEKRGTPEPLEVTQEQFDALVAEARGLHARLKVGN